MQVTDEQLVAGLTKCRDLGALPQVCHLLQISAAQAVQTADWQDKHLLIRHWLQAQVALGWTREKQWISMILRSNIG